MKRKLFILSVFVMALLVSTASAMADFYELDAATASGFTTYSLVENAGDSIGSLSIYDAPDNKIFGTGGVLYGAGTMNGSVGFVANLENFDADPTVTASISYGGNPGLTGSTYDGISAFFSNDNNSLWTFELFIVYDGTKYVSNSDTIPGYGASTVLSIYDDAWGIGSFDLSKIDDIGFTVSGYMTGAMGNPSSPDAFHVSVVPVPGALLLGLIGISAAGVKLRKHA